MERMLKSAKMLAEMNDINCYYGALYMTLSLIGACSKKEYPQEKDNVAFQEWVKKYYHPLCKELHNGMIIPAFTLYKFRCAVIHESATEFVEKKNADPHEFYLTTQSIHFVINPHCQTALNVKEFILELLQSIELWLESAVERSIDTKCSLEIITGLVTTKPINGFVMMKDCGVDPMDESESEVKI